MAPSTDPAAFRAEFPVFERLSYLNAGTEGPVPRRAAQAVQRRIEEEARHGRSGASYIESVMALASSAREGYAEVLGCSASEVALTGSTTDGVNTVISGLGLRPGDEVLTSDEEHPGLLAPLGRARKQLGIEIRVAPFEELEGHASARTRLIACSHVSYISGRVVNVGALVSTGVPVLLDAAQALGAIPVNMRELACDFYACSGQKWLCGPEGSGCLFVRADRGPELLPPWPGYGSVADPERALDFEPRQDASCLDHGFPVPLRNAWAIASLEVLGEAGWAWVHDRAASLAELLASRLTERGAEVAARGRSTLVSWRTEDAAEVVKRLAREKIVVRSIPGRELVRASVGAWASEEEVERLAALASA